VGGGENLLGVPSFLFGIVVISYFVHSHTRVAIFARFPQRGNAREIYDNERKEKKGRKAVLYSIKLFTNLNELISYEKVYHLMTVNLFSLQRKYIPTRYHLFQARYSTH